MHNLELDSVIELVSRVPVEPAMFGLAGVSAACWHAGTDQQKHLALAEEIFRGRPVLDQLRAFAAEDPRHLIFNEQHLTILSRLLLMHGAEGDARTDMTDAQVDALLMAMLGISALTERHADPEDSGTQPMGWVPWLVRSGLYFDRSNLGSDQARARGIFVDLASDADPAGPNWCDLDSWQVKVGSIEDQFAFGYALGAFSKVLFEDIPTVERYIGIQPKGLLAGNMEAATVEKLVAAISATRREFQQAFSESNDLDHLLWDRAPFEQHPFLQLEDGRLVLLGPRFLHSWMGEGVYYRFLDAAMHTPDPSRPEKRATLRFTRFHGELMERYVERLAVRSHRDQLRAGVVRIEPERTYRGKRGTEQKSPDLFLSFATDAVAIEVTGGRPSRRTRVLSDPSLLTKELDTRVIKKLQELDAALQDVLDGTAAIPGLRLDLLERVWPVLIVPATIIQSDLLWNYVDERAPKLFTRHPTMQRPTLLSIEDFERILAAVEDGAGLPAILATRSASVYARMPPSHFLARHFSVNRRPAYLVEQLRGVQAEAQKALSLAAP